MDTLRQFPTARDRCRTPAYHTCNTHSTHSTDMASGKVLYSAGDDDVIHLVPLDDDDDSDDDDGGRDKIRFRAIPCTRFSLVLISAVSLVFIFGMVIIGVIVWHIRHGTGKL